MDLDLKYLVFFGISIIIFLVLGDSSRILDDIGLEDSETIVDTRRLNAALHDLFQLEEKRARSRLEIDSIVPA